jgi:hypothetical protein
VAADKAFLEQKVQLWREKECFVAPELHLSGIALVGAGNALEERGGERGGGGGGDGGDRRSQGAARRPYGVKLEIVAATCDGFGVGPASRSFSSSSSEEEEQEEEDWKEEWFSGSV